MNVYERLKSIAECRRKGNPSFCILVGRKSDIEQGCIRSQTIRPDRNRLQACYNFRGERWKKLIHRDRVSGRKILIPGSKHLCVVDHAYSARMRPSSSGCLVSPEQITEDGIDAITTILRKIFKVGYPKGGRNMYGVNSFYCKHKMNAQRRG